MISPLVTPTFNGASRLTSAREGRQLGLAARALATRIFSGFESLCHRPIRARQNQPCQRRNIDRELAGRASCEGAPYLLGPGSAWSV